MKILIMDIIDWVVKKRFGGNGGMDFTSQDIAVIEKALQLAIQSEPERSNVKQYREVLSKLRTKAEEAMIRTGKLTADRDGIRYDYDDSSDLL